MVLTITQQKLIVDGKIEKGGGMADQKIKRNKPKKYYTVTMTFDNWVEINQEIQAKALFVGGTKKLTHAERLLLLNTNDILFGSGNAQKETEH